MLLSSSRVNASWSCHSSIGLLVEKLRAMLRTVAIYWLVFCLITIVVVAGYRFLTRIVRYRTRRKPLESNRTDDNQRQQVQEQRRRELAEREEIRFSCELLYDQHSPEIAGRFPRARLESYLDAFLNDKQSIEIVRSRGERLKSFITNAASPSEVVKEPDNFTSMSSIRDHFRREREAITSYQLDPDEEESLLAELAIEEHRQLMEFQQS